jgi:hypothetical protein
MKTMAERGSVLPPILILMVLLAGVGIAMLDITLSDVSIAANQRHGLAATYLADAGVSDAINRILGDANLGQTAACSPGTLTFPQGSLESGVYEVCIQRIGTLRLIVATGKARVSGDPSDSATKTIRYAVRVIPVNFAYAIFSQKDVELFHLPQGASWYAPVVIQTNPAGQPLAVRAGPQTSDGSTHLIIKGSGTSIAGGVSIGGTYGLQEGAVNPCTPTGSYLCQINTNGPAYPTFNIRFTDPGPNATSYEGKARADTVGCARAAGCYFSTQAAFLTWVTTCAAPKCQSAADGKILGPGIFFVNEALTMDAMLNIKEIKGTLVIGAGDLTIKAGFTFRPCTDPAVADTCAEPALVVRGSILVDSSELNKQCRDLLLEGMLYSETKDLTVAHTPNPQPSQGSCYPRNIAVRFGTVLAKENVKIHGDVRVEFGMALLDALPPTLFTYTATTPLVVPVGWVSQ